MGCCAIRWICAVFCVLALMRPDFNLATVWVVVWLLTYQIEGVNLRAACMAVAAQHRPRWSWLPEKHDPSKN
jgi:cell division protein FtsW (lipid II flippase)